MQNFTFKVRVRLFIARVLAKAAFALQKAGLLTLGRNCMPAGCYACENYNPNGWCDLFQFYVMCNALNPSPEYIEKIFQCERLFPTRET